LIHFTPKPLQQIASSPEKVFALLPKKIILTAIKIKRFAKVGPESTLEGYEAAN
jgi:hypothetical protein